MTTQDPLRVVLVFLQQVSFLIKSLNAFNMVSEDSSALV